MGFSSSLPDYLPPPLSFICIIAILIVYVVCCYLVLDFISQDEESIYQEEEDIHITNHTPSYYYYHLSVEELQDITCLHHQVGSNRSICAICLEILRQAEVCRVFPDCRHEFHARCIDPWLSKKLTCPTCRTPFRPLGQVFADEES
ncbi:hypothetical protein OROMI_013662 [Orobanche minor]